MSKKYISTLEFYNYGENYKMISEKEPPYKVKVSDKDGNIITIEKDDSLYACVKLDFDAKSGTLRLLDVAHENAVLAEIEMPNADYIYNCRFDEESNAILFDVKSLYGDETSTIELDVESLVELYEAGKGIEIGEKNPETGRKPISIKLAEGEELLQLTDNGLGLDEKVITEEELDAAISGKADVSYVDSIVSGISAVTEIIELVEYHDEEIEKLKNIVGTEEESPSLFEQIDSNREDIAELDEEIGDLSGTVDTVVSNVETISGDVETLKESLENEINRAKTAEIDLDTEIVAEENARKEGSVASVEYDSSAKTINFFNFNDELIDYIDATDFVKDGMIDSVYLETVSGSTYLVIVWNTAAGKETTRINLGDIFDADNYYTKGEIDEKVTALQEMDAALANVDTQQWAVINQNRTDLEEVDRQLWDAINNEITNRQDSDTVLSNAINSEIERRVSGDAVLNSKIEAEAATRAAEDERIAADIDEKIDTKVNAEKERAELAETRLSEAIQAEEQRATREEQRIETKYDDDIEDLRQEDASIRQDVNTKDAATNARIDAFNSALEAERDARQEADEDLAESINEIRENCATKEYVDTKDSETRESAINTAVSSAKAYTDTGLDELETSLKIYCDEEHDELRHAISENTTKINVISNLKGVSGTDTSNYDDSGNGILDVLHREFHQLEAEIGYIVNETLEKNNPPYEVAFGSYNVSNTGDEAADKTVFSIGIGTGDDDRKNAFEVREDGSIYMWIEGEFMKINDLIGMLAHEVY